MKNRLRFSRIADGFFTMLFNPNIMKHIKPRGLLGKAIFAVAQLLFGLVMLLVFGYPDFKSYAKRNTPRAG
ncbi:hypothetical protein [Desulfobacter vibrioformis]|uniref:hypothetical protein n=1 Tax=Desulfobacter vibrioformis TaxID=34031 RepID=UPI0012EB4996|nr:hypothetical protein [Desulfobacter vibrioformis]